MYLIQKKKIVSLCYVQLFVYLFWIAARGLSVYAAQMSICWSYFLVKTGGYIFNFKLFNC